MTRLQTLAQPDPDTKHDLFDQRIVIAGPCSAETEEQVMDTARALKDADIQYFRAGIWKPRTSPDSFEGVGEEGLQWLQRVKSEFGLRPAIEVANAKHVELALKYGVELLWIGARSTVNPFTVQEIADALKGVKVPVMVKNPINPDLGLWKGAMERILRADVKGVIACHRGFNVYGKSLLRNAPLWEIPIELKREFPELPIVCDPSHIAGRRDFIEEISRKALNLGYEGLMIETHRDPNQAWSDAAQQVTPDTLSQLLSKLQFRRRHIDDDSYRNQVSFLREEIDNVDEQLVEILARRMNLSKEIGTLKEHNNIAFYQHNRWSDIIEQVKTHAEERNLNHEFVLKLFSLIHLESIDIQGE